MTEDNNIIETPEVPEVTAKTSVVGVRFKSCGKIYTFDANGLELKPGARVVVDSDMGQSLGKVATSNRPMANAKDALKKVVRIATEKDFETVEQNRLLEEEARAFCMEKAKEMNLQLKVVVTQITLDKKRLVFYFTADGRIDFRELVRDLAAKFKTRIEMRQIGVRDEVKMLGGIGCCGRQACCNQFLTSFAPVTIRMAKQQSLSINQSKLSGICGRLMCCLGYEYNEFPEEEAITVIEDEPVIIETSEGTEAAPQPVRSEPRRPDTSRRMRPRPMRPEHRVEEKEKPSPAQREGQPEEIKEKAGEEKKRFDRDRGRRRRQRGPKPASEGAQQEQVVKPREETPHTDSPNQTETKDKARPFNKRRKFWKKKKKLE